MKCVLIADIGDKVKGSIVDVPPSDPDGFIGSGVAVPVKKTKPSGVKDGHDS